MNSTVTAVTAATARRQVGPDSRFHRGKFGRGPVRRFVDWLDWMLPEVTRAPEKCVCDASWTPERGGGGA